MKGSELQDKEMKFKLKDIQPNPFRNIDNYPINQEKVEELKRSMDRTDYWGNILGRLVDGKPEIAYGHHRRVAMLEKFGDSHMVDIIIRDLHDDDMIQIMASENMDAWASRAIVDIETVHAVVKAYGEDKINLGKVPEDARKSYLRYAPSFIPGNVTPNTSHVPFTGKMVADFLGWTKPQTGVPMRKVETCITALQYAEEGLLELSVFEKLNTAQMEAVVDETRNARKHLEQVAEQQEKQAAQAKKEEEQAREREAKATSKSESHEAAKERLRAAERRNKAELAAIEGRKQARETATTIASHLSKGMQKGEIATKHATSEAYKLRPQIKTVPPHIEDALRKILKGIGNFLYKGWDETETRLAEILTYKEHLSPSTRRDAASTLRGLAERAIDLAKRFEN
jgi:ParB-like nuclease domain